MGETQAAAEITENQEAHGFRHWFIHVFRWWLLPLPLIHIAVVQYISAIDLGVFADRSDTKDLFEIIHPAILATAFVVAALSFWMTRRFTFGWLTALTAVLFCREMHFVGSGVILVGGLLILIVVAARNPVHRRAFVQQRWAITLFLFCILCYTISQMFDRNTFAHIGRVIVQNESFEILHSSNVEESMESLGGLCLLLSILTTRRKD